MPTPAGGQARAGAAGVDHVPLGRKGDVAAAPYRVQSSLPMTSRPPKLVLGVLEQHVKAERDYPAGKFWLARPATASRVRGRIENVLDYAAALRELRSGPNPARWSGDLEHKLPPPTKISASSTTTPWRRRCRLLGVKQNTLA